MDPLKKTIKDLLLDEYQPVPGIQIVEQAR